MLPVYAEIEEQTGVPCEIMAGIHYREGNNDPTKSFEDGGALRGSILQDGILVAEDLLNDAGVGVKVPGGGLGSGLNLRSIKTWASTVESHNGGGNENCNAPSGLTDYKSCPPRFRGDDSNYVMAYADSNHDNMAIIFPADGVRADQFCSSTCGSASGGQYKTACGLCPPPIEEERVGALTLAKYLFNLIGAPIN